MRIIHFLTSMALSAALAVPAAAQQAGSESMRRDTVISLEDSTRNYLILSDAIAADEMAAALEHGIALADLGAERATSERVKDYARDLAAQHREHLRELKATVADLRRIPSTSDMAMGTGMAGPGQPATDTTWGMINWYWRDTVPVYRWEQSTYVLDTIPRFRPAPENPAVIADRGLFVADSLGRFVRDTTPLFYRQQTSYVRDTSKVYRMRTTVVFPVEEKAKSLSSLETKTGEAFDRAFLERQMMLAEVQRDRLRDRILPVLRNDGLQAVANDMQTTAGIQIRQARRSIQELGT